MDPTSLPPEDSARNTAPDATENELAALVGGNTEFSFDLYRAIKDNDDKNIFLSPYSISLALSLQYAGAENNTESQMADVLGFSLDKDSHHNAFNTLDLKLTSRGQGAAGADGGEFKLNIANAFWGQQGYQFQDSFLDTLEYNYGARAQYLDFENAPEAARNTINNWVDLKTQGMIKDALAPGAITENMRLVLANAIYFNAAWKHQFDESRTESVSFHLLDGSTVDADMMYYDNLKSFKHYSNYDEDYDPDPDDINFAAIELPYGGEEISMIIILPQADSFKELEAALDHEMLNTLIQNLSREEVWVTIPKFKFKYSFEDLIETLSGMGMPDAFTDIADFSGINSRGLLYIALLEHMAVIEVNESGTVAAAVTIGGDVEYSMPVFYANHPFIFLIRDVETNTILFLGRVMNPNG